MKTKANNIWTKFKDFWGRLSKKAKTLLIAACGGILILAVVLVIFLNRGGETYITLYEGLSTAETAQIYTKLKEKNIAFQMNDNGEITVPKEQWDMLVYQLAAEGFPKSTLAYSTYLDNNGFTTTESDKKNLQYFQLQDRLQDTLKRIDGVQDAAVTINIPENTGYVWDDVDQPATASVTLTMLPDKEVSPEMGDTVRSLVSHSAPNMQPEDVSVIDAGTGQLVPPLDSEEGYASTTRLEYQDAVEKRLEDKVKTLFANSYKGKGPVTAVASVTLDWDKMKQEMREVSDDNKTSEHFEEQTTLNGDQVVNGLVGEEINDDTPPGYFDQTGTQNGQATGYYRSIDYDVGYILTQMEKGEASITNASVSVVVPDANLTPEKTAQMIDMVSKSTGIDTDFISVSNLGYEPPVPVTPPDEPGGQEETQPVNTTMLLIIGAGALLLLIILFVVILILRKKKKKRLAAEAAALAEAEAAQQSAEDMEREMQEYKDSLRKNAQTQSKEDAIAEEIRDFAKDNPEITASLIRSWLKEDM